MAHNLSTNRFVTADIAELKKTDPEAYKDYIFSWLLSELIKVLEISIPPDRVFNRAKYNVMALVHEAIDSLD